MKIDPPGFIVYGKDNLPKVNAMREAKSQPDFYGIPIISDAAVLFTRASEMGNKPASCYTCMFKNKDAGTCQLIGPGVLVNKFQKAGIEYWPCCSRQRYGEPNSGSAKYLPPSENPDSLGLIWINAPYTGAEYGGATCGGQGAGDDCDHYVIDKGEKRDACEGACRVLRHQVANGDVCAAWDDDDKLLWRDAQTFLQGPEDQRDKKKLVSDILGKDK